MTNDEFRDKQFHLSVTAGMNQRYHQERASRWVFWDRVCKIAVGLLAVAGACLSFVIMGPGAAWWQYVSTSVAVSAAIAAIALNVLPLGDWANHHIALLQRWTDLREDVDSLLFDLGDKPTGPLKERLKHLDAKVHRICGTEQAPKEDRLRACYDEEYKSRVPGTASTCSA